MIRTPAVLLAVGLLWFSVAARTAPASEAGELAASPNQRFDIANNLWNPNATGKAQGSTPTAITLAFNNGGSSACYSVTLAFQGATTIYSGAGQPCVAPITSMSITPVAGNVGLVYSAPTPVTFSPTNFENQILIGDGVDPVFDTTNGLIHTPGTVNAQVNSS